MTTEQVLEQDHLPDGGEAGNTEAGCPSTWLLRLGCYNGTERPMRQGGSGMVQSANSDTEKKILSILRVLSESGEPLGSITIARELQRYGVNLSERAVRYHLQIMDERGYTQPGGRDGRSITPLGIEELQIALAPDQIGFILDKLELMAFQTTFNPTKRTGLLPVNTSIFTQERFKKALSAMRETFKAGLGVSHLVAVGHEGERLGNVVIPSGKVGLATVCSVAVNGVLLKAGVPVESRFGGVLEIRNSKPRRFTAIINYAGTSLDPSEQYMRASMTSVGEAARTGNGRILANFRELPAPSRSTVEETVSLLKKVGINGVYVLGQTGEPVCQIALGANRIGMVLLGGMNPVAAAVEAGVEVDNFSESGLIDFEQLVSFWDL
jgi:repressor of nif and glnA expression